MKLFIILALCSVGTAVSLTGSTSLEKDWEEFKLEYGKNYSSNEDETYRMTAFAANRVTIDEHNRAAANGLYSYTLKMNEFGDLWHHEFVKMMNGYRNASGRPLRGAPARELESIKLEDLPKSVDWREKGYVTPVKNQGNCGSCWAFSATGALEGAHFRKTGKLVLLSEQNLVDCSKAQGNEGCNGGFMDNAFEYIKKNNGIDTEKSYPYEGKDGKCRFSKDKIGATDTGFVDIKKYSEEELTKAIATVGPVAVAIDASSGTFQFYYHGVYYDEKCSSEELDHGVLAVGYGIESNGEDYYIVKNSWGDTWGIDGYIFMSRNKKNNCGIATLASYPTV